MVRPRLSVFVLILVVTLLLLLPASPASSAKASGQTTPTVNSEERESGKALYKQGKNAEAIAALKKAVKQEKADYQAWHFLGLAQIRDNKFKDASKSFETALRLQPGFAAARTGLGYTYLVRNKSADAIREAQTALTIDPNIPEARYIIGVVHLQEGKRSEALKEAEAIIKINPQLAMAYLLKSQALVSFLGDVPVTRKESSESREVRHLEAADALEKYLQLTPNSKERQTWAEQLESLRYYAISHRDDKTSGVFGRNELTTMAQVISKPEPRYTEEARASRVTGTVVLRCIFAADGNVKHFLVIKALPNGLTEAAIAAARRIKFTPATIDGRPVSMFIQLEYYFNLY